MTRPPTPARFSRRYSALPFASMSPMKRARKRDQIGWLTFGPAADPVTGGESLTGTLAIVPLSRIQAPESYDASGAAERAAGHGAAGTPREALGLIAHDGRQSRQPVAVLDELFDARAEAPSGTRSV